MKIGIVGCGMVGSTCAFALVMRGVGREIVMVDLNRARAQAEAKDIHHAVPFAHPLSIQAGEYCDLAGAQVVVIAAGVAQKPGETRLQLLKRNAEVFSRIVPEILRHASNAILVVVSNPVDVLTHMTAHFAGKEGVPATRVLGTGTMLDTARFRTLLGSACGVDPHHVHAYVIGEHGDSEVLTWSHAIVAGLQLDDFCRRLGKKLTPEARAQIDAQVRGAAYEIIGGKGATYYGIGSAVARLVEVLLYDQRSILTVSCVQREPGNLAGLTLSLPHLVGGAGVIAPILPPLVDDEEKQFLRSAAILRETVDSLGLDAAWRGQA